MTTSTNSQTAVAKTIWYRLRLFAKSRVVSSQISTNIEDLKAAGSSWAGQDGRNTYALSVARSSPLLRSAQ